MERIKLPLYTWFVCTQEGKPVSNFYTGSYGTDGLEGCFDRRIFNYRVFTEKKKIIEEKLPEEMTEEEKLSEEKPVKEITFEIFVAESYIIEAFKDGGKRTNELREEFERTEQGLEQIADWLTKNARAEGF